MPLAVASMRWTSPVSGTAAPYDGQDIFHQGDCTMSAAFIGLDLAKSVFQVHGVDAQGKVVVTKRGIVLLLRAGDQVLLVRFSV
jgi:hypothetical protein